LSASRWVIPSDIPDHDPLESRIVAWGAGRPGPELAWRPVYSDGSWWTLFANGIFQGRVFAVEHQRYYAGWFELEVARVGRWMDETFSTMRAAADHLEAIARARAPHPTANTQDPPQKKAPLPRRRR
jgi:hypothetical protein